MLKAILVDDEIAAIRTLELLLKQCCPDILVIGTARSGDEALQVIGKENPDIVFLDIEMPHGSGFDLLESMPNLNFDIIFITAYNQYAVKAFKYSAVDYILKPIDIDELVKAVDKVKGLRSSRTSSRTRYSALFDNLKSILPRKLVIPQGNSFQSIDLSSIILVNTQQNDLIFTMSDGDLITCSTCNPEISDILTEKGFLYICPNCYINLSKVTKVDKTGKGSVTLENGMIVNIETISKEEFIEKLTKHNL